MRFIPSLGTFVLVLLASACTDQVTEPLIQNLGPPSLSLVGGQGQYGYFGYELPEPLVVRATQQNGKAVHPLPNHLVNFVPTLGGGSLFAGSALTSPQGYAQDYWTLDNEGCEPSQPCTNHVEVRAVDPTTGEKLTHGVFEATGLPPVFEAVGCGKFPRAINDAGQMVLEAYPSSPGFFKVETGECVGMFGGYLAQGLNNHGVAAGSVRVYRPSYGSVPTAAIWEEDAGWTTFTPEDEHRPSYAYDINDQGQVTGWARFTSPANSDYAFVWTPSTGEVRRVGSLYSLWSSYGQAINDAGDVVGNASSPYTVDGTEAFFWSDPGEGEDPSLGMQRIAPFGKSSYAQDINNSGMVVGYYKTHPDDEFAWFLWSEGGGTVDMGMHSEDCGVIPRAINDHGVVVGSLTGSECDVDPRHFSWTESDGFQFLPKGEPPRDYSASVYDLNNLGQIAGTISGSGGTIPAVWWPPISWF